MKPMLPKAGTRLLLEREGKQRGLASPQCQFKIQEFDESETLRIQEFDRSGTASAVASRLDLVHFAWQTSAEMTREIRSQLHPEFTPVPFVNSPQVGLSRLDALMLMKAVREAL